MSYCSDICPKIFLLQVLDLGRLASWSYLRGLILAVSFQEKEMLFSFACSATPPVGLDNQTSASFCPYMGGNLLGERSGTEHASVLLGKPFLSQHLRFPPPHYSLPLSDLSHTSLLRSSQMQAMGLVIRSTLSAGEGGAAD